MKLMVSSKQTKDALDNLLDIQGHFKTDLNLLSRAKTTLCISQPGTEKGKVQCPNFLPKTVNLRPNDSASVKTLKVFLRRSRHITFFKKQISLTKKRDKATGRYVSDNLSENQVK